MRQKIDITDVETATKIRAKYLRALENEEFDLLHGGTFVRSFLRTYAQYLGLDAQRLIEEYRIHHEPRDEPEFQHIAPVAQRRREPPRGRPPGRGTILVAVVIGFLAFLLVLGLAGGEDDNGGGDGSERAGTQPQEQRPRARRERGERREERRPAARRVRVRIAPSTPVYVCWDRGPGSESTEIGTLASPRTFRGRRIRVNLGNPSARLSVNGRRVTLDGPGPFGFDVRPGGVDEIPVGERPCA